MAEDTDSEIRRRLGDRRYRRLFLLLKWTTAALEELQEIERGIERDGGSTETDPMRGLSTEVRTTLDKTMKQLRELEERRPLKVESSRARTTREPVRARARKKH